MKPAGGLGDQAALSGLPPASSPAPLCILMTREQGSLLPLPARAPGHNGKAEGGGPALGRREPIFLLTVPNPVRVGGGVSEFIPKEDVFSHQRCASLPGFEPLHQPKGREGRSVKPATPPALIPPRESPVL